MTVATSAPLDPVHASLALAAVVSIGSKPLQPLG
jgi:hypothetical protein